MRRAEVGALALLAVVILAAGLHTPRFWGPESLQSVLLWVPLLTIVGIGEMLVIATRGIDVSVGSIVGVSAMVVGATFRTNPNMPIAAGLAEGLAVGLALGLINAAIIAWGKVPPIVTTLGTLSAYRGLTFIVSGGKQVDGNVLPDGLIRLSQDGPIRVGSVVVPWILVICLVVLGLGGYFASYTRAGRDVFALGGNPNAARLRGVSVPRTTLLVYAVAGALAGLAGTLYLSRYGFANPATAGQGFELSVIAAVVIGGTRVTGGRGSVFGVFVGSVLLGTIAVALSVVGIAATWQSLAYGLVILVALIAGKALKVDA